MDDRRWTVFSLIAANFVPVLGVVFLNWNIASLLLLFWMESAVIAFYTILKIAVVGPRQLSGPTRVLIDERQCADDGALLPHYPDAGRSHQREHG